MYVYMYNIWNAIFLRASFSLLSCYPVVEICWFPLIFTTQKLGLKRFATPSWGGPQLGDSWGHLEPS